MNTKSNRKIEKKEIGIVCEYVNFRDIEEAEINAQEMSQEDFQRLVRNLKKDGVLTSTPLIMRQENKEKYRCVSGHHRIKAAIHANIGGAYCLIMDEVDDSTRIRLQLAHNDIQGTPNQDIVSILRERLTPTDIDLVDKTGIEERLSQAREIEYEIPSFSYINICLLEESRKSLVEIIDGLAPTENTMSWLIEKNQYEEVKDLLTIAFERGFKTPGQAFGKFVEIVKQHMEEVER